MEIQLNKPQIDVNVETISSRDLTQGFCENAEESRLLQACAGEGVGNFERTIRMSNRLQIDTKEMVINCKIEKGEMTKLVHYNDLFEVQVVLMKALSCNIWCSTKPGIQEHFDKCNFNRIRSIKRAHSFSSKKQFY